MMRIVVITLLSALSVLFGSATVADSSVDQAKINNIIATYPACESSNPSDNLTSCVWVSESESFLVTDDGEVFPI